MISECAWAVTRALCHNVLVFLKTLRLCVWEDGESSQCVFSVSGVFAEANAERKSWETTTTPHSSLYLHLLPFSPLQQPNRSNMLLPGLLDIGSFGSMGGGVASLHCLTVELWEIPDLNCEDLLRLNLSSVFFCGCRRHYWTVLWIPPMVS